MQTAAGTHYQLINFRGDLANDPFDTTRHRATAPTGGTANAASFASYALNSWLFLVATFDTAGANGDQKLLIGNLTTPPTEPSAYTAQQVGSGTPGETVSPFTFGNNANSTTRVFIGDIAAVSFFNRVLTANEIYQVWRFNAPLSGRIVQSHYGLLGTGTQPDWSGNGRTGTVTGATVSAHVPLGPLFAWSAEDSYVVAAAGGRTTKNTRAAPLGINLGMNRSMGL